MKYFVRIFETYQTYLKKHLLKNYFCHSNIINDFTSIFHTQITNEFQTTIGHL